MSDNEFYTVTLDVAVDPAGNKVYPVWRAPDYATVRRLTTVTSIAHNAGTAYAISVLNYGTAGTAVITGGTVIGALGGTASPNGALVPKTTSTVTSPFVTAGQYLVVSLTEQGAGWQAGEVLRVMVDVQFGKAADD